MLFHNANLQILSFFAQMPMVAGFFVALRLMVAYTQCCRSTKKYYWRRHWRICLVARS